MILKVNSKTGEIVMVGQEAFVETSFSPSIQIIEDGKEKFNPEDIQTYIIDGKTAQNYEDPRKPEFDIHKCKISQNISKKNTFILHDEKNKITYYLIKNEKNVGICHKIEMG